MEAVINCKRGTQFIIMSTVCIDDVINGPVDVMVRCLSTFVPIDALINEHSTNCIYHFRHSFPFVYRQNIANISQNLAWVCAGTFQFHISMRMSVCDVIDKYKMPPIVSCLNIKRHKRHTVMSHSLPWLLPKISLVVPYNLTSNIRDRQKTIQ